MRSLVALAWILAGLGACAGENDTGDGEGEGEGFAAALCVDPALINFAAVGLGAARELAVVVSNCGGADSGVLSCSVTGDFLITAGDCGAPLAAGASCSVTVAFAPTTVGPRTGELTVEDLAADEPFVVVQLAGSGVEGGRLVLIEQLTSFGDVLVGAQSAAVVLNVTNTASAPSDLIDTALGGAHFTDFIVVADACDGVTLAPDASCAIEVVFAPLSRGDKAAVVSVNTEAAALSGVGIADALLSISPSSRSFGAVGIGAEIELDVTVTNTGDVATGALGELIQGGSSAGFFISASGCTGEVLAANQGCTISVRFAPAGAVGARADALRVAATPGGEVTSSLTGTAVTSESISIDPTANDFGAVELGRSAGEQTFTVANDGGSSTGTLATTLSGVDAGQFTVLADACDGVALAAGATCDVSLAFAPSTAGDRAATLIVTADSGGQALAALVGVGVSSPPITTSPLGIDFGTTVAGSQSALADVVVTNPSAFAVGAPAGELEGANPTQFAMGNTTCVAPLAPAESCVFSVRHAPTSSSGAQSATLVVTASGGGTTATQLTGTSVENEGMTFTGPAGYAAGDVVIGAQAATTATITVMNIGKPETGVISTVIVGADAASFVIVSEDCITLTSGATCSITVRFDPQAPAGAKVAQLSVSATPGNSIVSANFTGNALAP